MTGLHSHLSRFNKTAATLAITSLTMLTGCGSGGQLPGGATVTVSPESRTIRIAENLNADGQCVFDPNRYLDLPVQVLVTDVNQAPIGKAELQILSDWSGNTFPGVQAMQVYWDTNGNGVVDAPDELASGPGMDALRVSTQRYSGVARFFVRVNLSCTYRGDVTVMADGAVGTMNVDITLQDPAVGRAD